MAEGRKKPRTVVGEVVSNKMEKTIVVQVARLVKHPQYGKYVKKYTRYFAHDERGEALEGDKVELVPARPLSKRKRWRLKAVLSRKGGAS